VGMMDAENGRWSRRGDETKMNRRVAISLITSSMAAGLTLRRPAVASASSTRYRELKRYAAPEARQAVAVDSNCFYAIGNNSVAKYGKESGARIAGWECPEGKPLIHLNSGVVLEGRLYCAHSNYPDVPMTGSIEIWDTHTMQHVGNHSFGIGVGSATWADFFREHWYVGFAHYQNKGAEPDRDPSWTSVVKFTKNWNRLEGWIFPREVIQRFAGYSCSGGVIDDQGLLYCTGHDAPEIYVLKFPDGGSILELIEVIEVTFPGQGIAWDRSSPATLYSISKASRQVIVSRIIRS
jgi:hypothetical protein